MYTKMFDRQASAAKKAQREEPQPEARTPEPAAEPVAEQVAEKVLAQPPKPKRSVSLIGTTLVLKGDLFAQEDLLIEGTVLGSITHEADDLTIGTGGDVKADIVARHVVVRGKVRGDVRASESIVVEASARIEGNLYAPSIELKEGARFKGSVDMDPESWAPKGKQGGSAGADADRRATGSQNAQKPAAQTKPAKAESAGAQAGSELSEARVEAMLN
jgi:cytoskeletal protein CcmA (bactofilin family)